MFSLVNGCTKPLLQPVIDTFYYERGFSSVTEVLARRPRGYGFEQVNVPSLLCVVMKYLLAAYAHCLIHLVTSIPYSALPLIQLLTNGPIKCITPTIILTITSINPITTTSTHTQTFSILSATLIPNNYLHQM